MKVPFVDLKAQYNSLKEEIDNAIYNVINETAFIGGKYVSAFEKSFAEAYGVKNCISCANGTDSLYVILKMLGIGPGDEVITVANSWISTSETITQTGAKVIFVDCDPTYYTIDENQIEEIITSKTKAIIPVHLYGQMCNMTSIMELAKKYNLQVIEDCAQSHFSSLNRVNAGLYGIAASFSFYPGKNLGAYGDAGCMITNDDNFAEKLKLFARHGALVKHQHVIEGINSRMDGLQAAILSAKLPHLLDWTRKRQNNATLYTSLLMGLDDLVLPSVRADSSHSFHLYVIQTSFRDELSEYLRSRGIETAIHYPTPLPLLKAYEYLEYNSSQFPVASKISKQILSLPLYPELTDAQIEYVVQQIRFFYKKM